MDLLELAQKIEKIEQRNRKVEADKAWEGSLIRKFCIILLTYVVVVIFMATSGIGNPFVSAIVPSIGFFLSTLTLPFVKKKWTAKHK